MAFSQFLPNTAAGRAMVAAADAAAQRTLLGLGTADSPTFAGINTPLLSPTSHIFSQRNSTSAQASRVYNTWTDASNGEWFAVDWQTTSNVCTVGPAKNGTGTVRTVTATGSWTFASALSLGSSGQSGISDSSGTLNLLSFGAALVTIRNTGIVFTVNNNSTYTGTSGAGAINTSGAWYTAATGLAHIQIRQTNSAALTANSANGTAFGIAALSSFSGDMVNCLKDNVSVFKVNHSGIMTTAGTANLRASTTAAGTAPIKIATGVLMTSPEAGAIEYDGTNLYFTDSGGTRRTLAVV